MTRSDPEAYFERMREALALESDAERARMAQRRSRRAQSGNSNTQALESRGDTLTHLVVIDHRTGLGGRAIVTFGKRNPNQGLPWNRFRVGAPVVASDEVSLDDVGNGIVSARNAQTIDVVFDDLPEGTFFRLELSADEVTRARLLAAMSAAQQARGRMSQWRDLLLGERLPQFDPPKPIHGAEHLNASQIQAVQFGLSARDFAIIHGPPGTGKTTTVAELIRQAVLRGERVLACAPSNTGVDNLLEKLIGLGVHAVRIGHPARVHELLQHHTLDSLADSDPAMKLVRQMHKEAETLMAKSGKWTRGKPAAGAREELRYEARRLREDAKAYEKQIIASILDRADVICATTNYDPEVLGDRTFSLGVIDEACQSTEPGYWPVVLRTERLILAGDHCQLPPTVLSHQAAQLGFATSMMERLVQSRGEMVTAGLQVQYRMHEQIMRFPSTRFYKDRLSAHDSVASHMLTDLSPGISILFPESPITFVDTAGASWDEAIDPEGESKFNPKEGMWVLEQVEALIEQGISPDAIAVIAPYSAQVRWLRDRCRHRDVEIDTVDGFQGREKEAVLITLVRSNDIGEIGFLGDERRMNVAMTRAKRKLIMIGDGATLARHEFYASLIAYFESIGAYHSVWEWGG